MYKKIKNNITIAVLTIVLAATFSCETTELELVESPNNLTVGQADVDLFLNNIQLKFLEVYEGTNTTTNNQGFNEIGQEVTRMLHMLGPTYNNAYDATTFNEQWRAVYSGALPDIRLMTPIAEENELYTHVGIAKVLEAYMMINLVDFFGDVPYSETGDPDTFSNPKVDSGAEIYIKMEALLNEAIIDFNKTEKVAPKSDMFYRGDEDKWLKLINTLKLKIYAQTRLVDNTAASKINTIIAGGNYITDSADDFQFQYSAVDNNPDSRHPEFGPNFDNGTGEYMSTSFMNWMVADTDKGVEDPRWRYYFYRQVEENTTDENEQSCITQTEPAHFTADDIFCNIPTSISGLTGFWGRIHGNDDGTPPDRALRTAFGVYPVGGQFDDNSTESINNRNIGLKGAGIAPIMLASYVDFMLAETALKINTTGDARAYLEDGIRKSITKVQSFADAGTTPVTDTDVYVNAVLALYDAAATEDDKLEVIVKEYMIALFGNGVEPYNTYRRTGLPRLQQTRVAAPGPYIRSFFYPDASVNANSSIDQKPDQSVKVFWDNNPDGFIN